MKPYYADDTVRIFHGDCLDVLRELPDASVDAVVTDPPYGLEFMGKEWDGADGFRRSLNPADVDRDNPFGRASRTSPEYRTDSKAAAGMSRTGYTDGAQRLDRPSHLGGLNPKCRVCDKWQRGGNPCTCEAPDFPNERLPRLHLFQQWCEAWATECLRVLKPGGHLLAFGGTRTSHRLACAVEDAGFEIRDSIAWLYGSGFPKSLDVSKAIDKAAGVEREVVGTKTRPDGTQRPNAGEWANGMGYMGNPATPEAFTAPATAAARTWQGWGTALKPAHEPVVVARKPLAGTVAANVLAHGTGALNVDGCRVGTDGERIHTPQSDPRKRQSSSVRVSPQDDVNAYRAAQAASIERTNTLGRWPANVVLDESQAAALDAQNGELMSGANPTRRGSDKFHDAYGDFTGQVECEPARGADAGGASRFFYTAKAASSERVKLDGTAHPTVKPLALMRWLVRLVTPPGGTVLEPFAGSGTTVEACIIEGFACIAIEREADYLPLIRQRIHRRRDPVEAVRGSGEDAGLFDLLGGEPA